MKKMRYPKNERENEISKNSKTMYENTRASRPCIHRLFARVFIHCFLVFGYPGETLALVVHILHLDQQVS